MARLAASGHLYSHLWGMTSEGGVKPESKTLESGFGRSWNITQPKVTGWWNNQLKQFTCVIVYSRNYLKEGEPKVSLWNFSTTTWVSFRCCEQLSFLVKRRRKSICYEPNQDMRTLLRNSITDINQIWSLNLIWVRLQEIESPNLIEAWTNS